jgi:hypothetical protein
LTVLAAAALVVASVPGFTSVAQAAPASAQFQPGSSVAFKPTYDAATGRYTYKCVFSGWAQGGVHSTCELFDPVLDVTIANHEKTFDGSAYSTPVFYTVKNSGETICVLAKAEYTNDATKSSKNQKCS